MLTWYILFKIIKQLIILLQRLGSATVYCWLYLVNKEQYISDLHLWLTRQLPVNKAEQYEEIGHDQLFPYAGFSLCQGKNLMTRCFPRNIWVKYQNCQLNSIYKIKLVLNNSNIYTVGTMLSVFTGQWRYTISKRWTSTKNTIFTQNI